MPLVYRSAGRPDLVLRKPPSHFVFATETDLVSEHAVRVLLVWQDDFEPRLKIKRLEIEQLLQFGDLVDRMTLWETLDEGADYRIRYHGTEIGRIFGEGTGNRLSTTPKAHFDALIKILDLVQSSQSVVVNGPALNAFPGRLYLVSQSLFMPVFGDDEGIKQVLVYNDYFSNGDVERA